MFPKKNGQPATRQAVSDLYFAIKARNEGINEWWLHDTRRPRHTGGRRVVVSQEQYAAIGEKARELKERFRCVFTSDVQEHFPDVCRHPVKTDEFLSRKFIAKAFRMHGWDVHPEAKWEWIQSKKGLTMEQAASRDKFATWWLNHFDAERRSRQWLVSNVVYIDPFSVILHTPAKAGMADKRANRGRNWQAREYAGHSMNQPRDTQAAVQTETGAVKWVQLMIMTRGVIHVVDIGPALRRMKNPRTGSMGTVEEYSELYKRVMPGWTESKVNLAYLASTALPVALNELAIQHGWKGADGAIDIPRYLWSDNGAGQGFSKSDLFLDAIAGWRGEFVLGDNVSKLPGWFADVHPHETAIAILKNTLRRKIKFARRLDAEGKETVQQFRQRRDAAIQYINTLPGEPVKKMCGSLDDRILQCARKGGQHIGK